MSPIFDEAVVLDLLISDDLNWTLSKAIRVTHYHHKPPFATQPPVFLHSAPLFDINRIFLQIVLSFDPLEQFDVLSLPAVGGGLTNLSLLLALNVLIMGA